MKKLFSILCIASCLTAFAAPEYCISSKHMEINYGSSLNYNVSCDNGLVTKTKEVVVNVLLIPIFGWNKRNEAKFQALMEELGQEVVVTFDEPFYKKGYGCEPLVISSSEASSNNEFCVVSEIGTTEVGIQSLETKHDYSVICKGEAEKVFNGVVLDDIDGYMSKRGYDRVANFDTVPTFQSRLLKCADHFEITAQYIYQK